MPGHLEILVGLDVSDDEAYADYRAGMGPILRSFGGGFGYDFKIAQVLKSESEIEINRLFTIRFPDRSAMDAFFSDPDYLERFFEPSVNGTVIIARYRVESGT